MAKTDMHGSNEYYLSVSSVSTHSQASTLFPIPVAGHIVRFYAGCEVSPDSNQVLTFELYGNAMQSGGGAASLTLLNADAVGDAQVIEFDQGTTEYAIEPEHNDLIATGGVFNVISDVAGAAGRYSFVLAIRV